MVLARNDVKKEFLEDYMAKEEEEYKIYEKQFLSSDDSIQYPPRNRFKKLREPIIYYDPFSYDNYGEKLWSQIPFAGTLIISLRNITEKNCLHQSFEPSDIPNLINLAKDQGRVQFGFQADVRLYEGLDYLDPIFEELKPPLFRSIPPSSLVSSKDSKHWHAEFVALGQIRYFDEYRKMIHDSGEDDSFFRNMMNKRIAAWEQLHLLNWNEAIKDISDNMIDDPAKAEFLFEKYLLTVNPMFDAFTPNVNLGLKELQRYDAGTFKVPENIHIPEIGNFIMQKTLLHPYSYNSCIEVITHYEQNELYSVMSALYTSIRNQRTDETLAKINNLDEVMENAWQDGKKLQGRSEIIDTGIMITLGLCGGLITNIPGLGAVGLLAKLGFKVAEHKLSLETLGDKIIKKINPNYLTTIYDFQKKVPLKMN